MFFKSKNLLICEVLALAFLTSSCGLQPELLRDLSKTKSSSNAEASNVISGTAFPFIGLLAKNSQALPREVLFSSLLIPSAFAASCSGASVSLYALGADGKKLTPALMTASLAVNATYSFEQVRAAGANEYTETTNLVEASGCDKIYARPVTDLNFSQDISGASNLIALAPNADTPISLRQISRLKILNLINLISRKIQGSASALNDTVFNATTGDPEILSAFSNAFGTGLNTLQEAAPMIREITAPLAADELVPVTFEAKASHFRLT
ncbi:MAG: hypothetical protein HY459_03235, partial [Parcubacteria group bacterium]|nr:hypothetical protein [Parcubacteria group bacterium]